MKRTALLLLLLAILLTPLTVTAQAVQTPYRGIWIGAEELSQLPTSGPAWDALKKAADTTIGTPKLSNQDDNTDQYVLAKALVYARTGETKYRDQVVQALKSVPETENGGRTLALGRNLLPYVIAADLINLPAADPEYSEVFSAWLTWVRRESLDGRTLISTHEDRPNNWGTHAGASRVAAAIYLDDEADLDRAALVFRGWLGDTSAYNEFSYGELDWQCDPENPVGINPVGCELDGIDVDGAQPEEMRRGGGLEDPPAETGYPWEALQGALPQAYMLERAGYEAFSWEDRALLRAVEYLYRIGWQAEGDDEWQVWLVNFAYGTDFDTVSPARFGKNMGWTDWTFAGRPSSPPVTPEPSPTATEQAPSPEPSPTDPAPTPTDPQPTPTEQATQVVCTCTCTCSTEPYPAAPASSGSNIAGYAGAILASLALGAGGMYAAGKSKSGS